MNKKEIKKALKQCVLQMDKVDYDLLPFDMCVRELLEEGKTLWSVGLGYTFSLDPCGKHHCMLSPNGITKKCERYWDNLYKVAEELDCWIDTSEAEGAWLILYQYRDMKVEDYKQAIDCLISRLDKANIEL